MTKRTRERPIDGPPFVMGLITIFRQYHYTKFKKYLLYISHYVKAAISNFAPQKGNSNRLPQDVALVLAFMEEIVRFGKMDKGVGMVKQYFGSNYIFDNFKLNQVKKVDPKAAKK